MRNLLSILIISLLISLGLFSSKPGRSATSEMPKTDGTVALTPADANERPDQMLLDRMIGDWNVDYAIYDEHGQVSHYGGSATYRWILDGAAIQEIWTSDYHGRKTQPYGMTVEFYDAERKRWTAVWIFPEKGMYYSVSGGEAGGRIVLAGNDQRGVLQRWSTEDFRADSFVGRFEVSKDGGKTWRLVGVNRMQRQGIH